MHLIHERFYSDSPLWQTDTLPLTSCRMTPGSFMVPRHTITGNVRKSLALKEKINSALYHRAEERDKA